MKMYFESFDRRDSNELTAQIADFFASESGPISECLKKLIAEKDFLSLASYQFDYNLSWDPVSLYCARQCIALFSKRDDIDLGLDREQLSLDKFIECEEVCKQANKRISRARYEAISPRVASVLFTAQRKISDILGDLPSLSDLQLAYGPGANTNVRNKTSARWKLSAKPACSANMFSSVVDVLCELPMYTSLHSADNSDEEFWRVDVDVCEGELMFVPKDAKIDRAIIVEPSLNSLVQKGYGTYIKQRLLRHNVNLYDQSINRRRARIGSITNGLMTVDLSSASDTICKELVSELLPLDWYIALSSARTSAVRHLKSDTLFNLEKFSSMGNGFTFELESLIFYALTVAVCHYEGVKPDVSVYGDDIICRPEVFDALEEVFSFCGFSINMKKSYCDGPFRESCGTDFFKGVNVRPFFQRTSWSWATLTAFHNFLVRNSWSIAFPEVLEFTLRDRPDHFLNYGPDGYGDGHLLGVWPVKPLKRDRGWSGYVFDTYIQRARRCRRPAPGDCILPVYSVYMRMSDSESFDPYVIRGARGEKRISVYTLGRF